MVRLYRIGHNGTPRYAAEREGSGGSWTATSTASSPKARRSPQTCPVLRAGHAVQDRLRRSELQGSRGRAAQAAAGRAVALPQAAHRGHRPGRAIEVPTWAGRIDHEAELGIVIGKRRRACRSMARRTTSWDSSASTTSPRAKCRTRSAVHPRAKGLTPSRRSVRALRSGWTGATCRCRGYVNGALRQDSRTRELIFTIPEMIEYISSVMTLLPGDIIATGTPSGIGPIKPGDR